MSSSSSQSPIFEYFKKTKSYKRITTNKEFNEAEEAQKSGTDANDDSFESFLEIVQQVVGPINETNNIPNTSTDNKNATNDKSIDLLLSQILSHSQKGETNEAEVGSTCSSNSSFSVFLDSLITGTLNKSDEPKSNLETLMNSSSSEKSFGKLMTFLMEEDGENLEQSDGKSEDKCDGFEILKSILEQTQERSQEIAVDDKKDQTSIIDSGFCVGHSEILEKYSNIISTPQISNKDISVSNVISAVEKSTESNIITENDIDIESPIDEESDNIDVLIPSIFAKNCFELSISPTGESKQPFLTCLKSSESGYGESNSKNFSEEIYSLSQTINKPITRKSKRRRINSDEGTITKLDNIVDVLMDSEIRTPFSDLTNTNMKIRSTNIEKIGTEKWLSSAINRSLSCDALKMIRVPVALISSSERKSSLEETSEPYIKRYRKGGKKIYRLKAYKTKPSKEQDVDFKTIIENLTQISESSSNNERDDETVSFKSIPESYESDESKSVALSTGSGQLSESDCKLRVAFNRISKDKTLIYHNGCDRTILKNVKKNEIKEKIKDLFLKVFEAFRDGKSPCFNLRRAVYENCTMQDGMLTMKPFSETSIMSNVNYCNNHSRTKFSLMLYLMAKIYSLLEHGTKLTKREMFYQIKHIIKTQGKLDEAVSAISNLLNVGQWDLNIISHCGLVYGDLKLVFSSGEVTNCNVAGTMIPYELNDIVEIRSSCFFILVVEKESIFCKLIEEDLPNKLTRPFIMITGKGFPDLNTQLFLKRLWTILAVPVFILVDADPHGIQIMITYRFGSLNSSHLSHYLAVPNARWIGVFPSEIMRLGMKYTDLDDREEKMVNKLIESPYVIDNPRIKEELKLLMTNKRKAAIEGLMRNDKYLGSAYLPTKFFTQDYV